MWGDVCGYVWGKRNEVIEVGIGDERKRQTYFGAVNLMTKAVHVRAYETGNGECLVEYVGWCQDQYPGKKLLFVWDGATYHTGEMMKSYLAQENEGLEEKDWKVTCVLFAPNAPDQNPVEEVWLKGKNHLRKRFSVNKTFPQVKQCFRDFLSTLCFESAKLDWYWPTTQLS